MFGRGIGKRRGRIERRRRMGSFSLEGIDSLFTIVVVIVGVEGKRSRTVFGGCGIVHSEGGKVRLRVGRS